jgi:predicted lysophospholipase L1 biosynthesis ABC-type transport system permease subunit
MAARDNARLYWSRTKVEACGFSGQLTRGASQLSDRFEIAVQATRNPDALGPMLRRIVHDVAPTAAVETVTLSQRVAASVEQPRFAMTILGAFAVLAVGLASIGPYGVRSYGVSQRRRELGVRSALGAAQRDVIRLVVGEGLAVTIIGLVIGLVAAGALTRLMPGVLFGVAALDVVSFVTAPMVLLIVAALALCVSRHAPQLPPPMPRHADDTRLRSIRRQRNVRLY